MFVEVVEANISHQLAALAQELTNLSPIMDEIGELLLASFQANFQAGGRIGTETVFGGGSEQWLLSQRAIAEDGRTLLDTAQLASSIYYRTSGNSITFGSNKVYARIHQLGGKTGKGHAVEIPARPYLVIQSIDLIDIQQVIAYYYASLFS